MRRGTKAEPPRPPTRMRKGGRWKGCASPCRITGSTPAPAPPQHRLHQRAAQPGLKAMLPEAGMAIKGHMRSQQEMCDASGYATPPRAFRELVRLLDSEVRVIAPPDPGARGDASWRPPHPGGRPYP